MKFLFKYVHTYVDGYMYICTYVHTYFTHLSRYSLTFIPTDLKIITFAKYVCSYIIALLVYCMLVAFTSAPADIKGLM